MRFESRLIIESDLNHLYRRGADIFSWVAGECVRSRGRFTVAISGGSTPRPMHRMLCEEPYLTAIPWKSTVIFWVDERCVPVDDPASNYGTARADFLDTVPIPDSQVHPMPRDLPPREGASLYERELVHWPQHQTDGIPIFDLICLGIGTDGHTASLFPGQEALTETKRLVVSVTGGNPNVERLTLTLPLINQAREIVFMVSGKEKATTLKGILEGPPGIYPAQLIQPVHGNLTWLLDREAASYLTRMPAIQMRAKRV